MHRSGHACSARRLTHTHYVLEFVPVLIITLCHSCTVFFFFVSMRKLLDYDGTYVYMQAQNGTSGALKGMENIIPRRMRRLMF
ncbi:hypothetical protein PUN28_001551 [Cardiocondyla obscurior]|uniref:Uncharacterized protein n=1 Tax=Cardiocondyla obscurior TaxID=286306 RepID=A0AAW2H5J5_9HYME